MGEVGFWTVNSSRVDFRVFTIVLWSGRSPADFRINRLRFAFSRLRFAWVSRWVVCGVDPGNGDSTNTLRGTLG